jgi:hypothetical protein
LIFERFADQLTSGEQTGVRAGWASFNRASLQVDGLPQPVGRTLPEAI